LPSSRFAGLEAVKRPNGTKKHRRSTNECRPTASTIARSRCGDDCSRNPTGNSELSQRIATLDELTAQQLRDEWRRLYRGQPPRQSRDLLIRTVAHRMQELAYGALSKATQRKLAALTKELEARGASSSRPIVPQAGTRLVREWRAGRTRWS